MDLQLMLKLMNTLGQMRQHERWTRPQLEAYQAQELLRLREFAYARSPFYQRFHKGLFERPLCELPVLTKATVMENFDELVTDRAIRLKDVRAHMANDREGKRFLTRYWVTATSGSTGKPGVFLFNRDEWVVVVATLGRAHEWAGVPMTPSHRMKMASVASLNIGSPWHMGAQVANTFQSKWMRAWMPTLSFDAAQPLTEIVRQLNDWKPHIMAGYASMMRILADEQLAGRLHIHPHMIVPGSEVLTDETRRRIEAAWGYPPFNAYGDKVLITTLFSRTQPLIRYELSDSVRLAVEPSSLNLPFVRIDAVQGRTEDILHLPAVSGGEVAVHPITFHHVLDSLPVSGWQVVQEQVGLRVLLSGAPNGVNDSTLVDALTRSLAAQNVIPPHISVQQVDVIPKNSTGKAPLIKAYHTPSEVTS